MYSEIFNKLLNPTQISTELCAKCITPINKLNKKTKDGCQECKRARAHIVKQQKLKNTKLPVLPSLDEQYDCLVGLSGGVDSSWLVLKLIDLGYKPFCIHLDNGWNTGIATDNIYKLGKILNLEIETKVLDWDVFRKLQRSFIQADVIDLELCSDHAIFSTLFLKSIELGGVPIFQGINSATENSMPPGWIHSKHDARNIKSIYKKYTGETLKSYPLVSTLEIILKKRVDGIRWISALDYFDYSKSQAEIDLNNRVGYVSPRRKHEESVITKIYQRIILPIKFNADKRIGHISSQINSGLISREEGLEILSEPIYLDRSEIIRDCQEFCENLDMTFIEFLNYLSRPKVNHNKYKTDSEYINILMKINKIFK
jgi:hypothetical protein